MVDQWMRAHHTLRLASYHVRAARALLAWRPDVVHANDANTLLPAWVVGSRLRIPYVYDSHELWTHRMKEGSRPVARRWEAWLERRLARRAAAVITVSPGIADWMHRNLRLAERPRLVRNVPAYFGAVEPRDGRLREMAGLSSSDRVVVHVGAATIGRNLEHVVDTMAHLPEDVHLVLLGPAAELFVARLLSRATDAGVAHRVHHVGAVAHHDVARAAADADVSIVSTESSTLSQRHALPNKLFESIHAGLPVVAADLPDIREVVLSSQVGITAAFEDPRSTSRSILEVLSDSARYREAAQDAARSITWEAEAERLVDVHADALSRVHGRGRAARGTGPTSVGSR